MDINKQELSIRANRVIQYLRDHISDDKPLSVAKPNKKNPEITIINGETREVVSVKFTPESVQINSKEINTETRELKEDTLMEIVEVIERELF